jgi:hypothetical protein
MIEIINGNRERIALHERRYSGSRYITEPEHMTEGHRRQAENNSRTGKDYIKWASVFGDSVRILIEKMLKEQAFEETAYRSCVGVINFANKFSPQKLNDACTRALEIGRPNYTTVKMLLQNPPIKKETVPLPKHENLRNPAEFA